MGSLTYSVPVVNQPNSTEDPKVANALTAILAFANGGIDKSNLATNSGILELTGLSNHKITFGLASMVFSGSSQTGTITISHGLGSTPTAAFLQSFFGGTVAMLTNWSSTTLSAFGQTVNGSSITISSNMCWAAIL